MSAKDLDTETSILHGQFSLLLENLSIGVFTVDVERRITSFNETVQRLTGLKEDEVIGKKCYEVFFSDLCHGQCMYSEAVKASGKPLAFDIEIQDESGGRRHITKLVSPILSSDGKVTGCIEILQDSSLTLPRQAFLFALRFLLAITRCLKRPSYQPSRIASLRDNALIFLCFLVFFFLAIT